MSGVALNVGSLSRYGGRINSLSRAIKQVLPDMGTAWPYGLWATHGSRIDATWDTRPLTAPDTRVVGGVTVYSPHNMLARSWRMSSWTASNWTATPPTFGGQSVVLDGAQTGRFTATDSGSGYYLNNAFTGAAGQQYTITARVARVSGNMNINLGTNTAPSRQVEINPSTGAISGSGAAYATVTAVAGGWKVDISYTPGASGGVTLLAFPQTGSTVTTYDIAYQVTLGGSLAALDTDGNARYLPFPGTTAPAAPLPGPWNNVTRTGLARRIGPTGLDEWGPHNLLLNSDTLSTQNVTTTAQQYTLKFSGAGTVTLSGTATGACSAGTTTFTASAGTLTLTVSGSVTTAQLNVGAVATEYVPTTSAARYLPRIAYSPTLDVNGQPYTLTESYGAERVTNGDFSTTPGNYLTMTSTSLVSGGVGRITSTDTGTYRGARITFAGVTAGRTYRAVAKMRVAAGSSTVTMGFMGGARTGGVSSASFVEQTVFFVANGTTIYLDFLFNTGTPSAVGDAFELDDISVREFLGVVPNAQPMCLGLQVEGAATNLAGPSQAFNDSAWIKIGSRPDAAAAIAPDGTPTAEKLVELAGSNNHWLYKSIGAAGVHTGYVFAKAAERSMLVLRTTGASGAEYAYFNLATGAVAGVGPGLTANIMPRNNGWYLCWITATLSGAAPFVIGVAEANGVNFYTGDGSSGIYIFQADFVAGSVPTSPIPNPTTGTAIRAGDFEGVVLTGDALTSAFPQGWTHSGVIVIRKSYSLGSDEAVWALCAGSSFGATNGLALVINGSSVAIAAANTGASAAGLLTDGSPNTIRYSVDASAGKASISVNGGSAVEATGLSFTGVGTTHLVSGALTTSGTSAIRQTFAVDWRVVQGQYVTGAALQALTA